MRISSYKWKSTPRNTSVQMRLCTWKTAIYKFWFTNLQLQSCNVSMFRIQSTKATLHLQNTKLHSSNFGLQVWNDITHMYIYGTTNHKYWFTNLQLHGCNVRILTPLAFHIHLDNRKFMFGHIDMWPSFSELHNDLDFWPASKYDNSSSVIHPFVVSR